MRGRIIAVLVAIPMVASAGFFTDVVDAISGHIDDLNGRLADDQFIEGEVERSGQFREDDPGQDLIHRGGGSVSIIWNGSKRYIQLEDDFWTTPGPDYHVYVSAVRGISDESGFYAAETTELGRLIKGSGASFYEIPEGIEIGSVTIWCKQFGEFIASADIN